MSLSINTNIASLQAQNNLSQVNKALEQNQERLSSGLRINSAADDAAGLAISDRMTAQVKGMNQASRNASDGISMAQTAEGGMQEITNILQRMREIGVQSANETNTDSDRESLNQEFQELSGELDRIAQSTSFNGKALLDGSRGTAEFQVGANTGSENIIEVDMNSSMRSQDLGKRYTGSVSLSSGTGVTLGSNEVAVNGETLDLSTYTQHDESASDSMPADGQVRTSAAAIADAINNSDAVDVDASAQSVTIVGDANSSVSVSDGGSGSTATYSLSINDQSIISESSVSGYTISATDLADKINNNDDLNVTAEATASGIELTDPNGGNIEVDENASGSGAGDGNGFFVSDGTTTQIARGGIDLESESSIKFSDEGASQEFAFGASGTKTIDSQNSGLSEMDVTTVDNAHNAIDKIDNAINDVDSYRATMGATQNRLESTIANLENSAQNLTEARSRIKDADIAKEAAEQTQNNVRRQAAASVLTQANQSPQLALQLLGG